MHSPTDDDMFGVYQSDDSTGNEDLDNLLPSGMRSPFSNASGLGTTSPGSMMMGRNRNPMHSSSSSMGGSNTSLRDSELRDISLSVLGSPNTQQQQQNQFSLFASPPRQQRQQPLPPHLQHGNALPPHFAAAAQQGSGQQHTANAPSNTARVPPHMRMAAPPPGNTNQPSNPTNKPNQPASSSFSNLPPHLVARAQQQQQNKQAPSQQQQQQQQSKQTPSQQQQKQASNNTLAPHLMAAQQKTKPVRPHPTQSTQPQKKQKTSKKKKADRPPPSEAEYFPDTPNKTHLTAMNERYYAHQFLINGFDLTKYPSEVPYIPQKKDQVYLFRKGYEEWRRQLNDTNTLWDKLYLGPHFEKEKWPFENLQVIEAVVKDIKYEAKRTTGYFKNLSGVKSHGNFVVSIVRLKMVQVGTQKPFEMRYAELVGQIEWILHKPLVTAALSRLREIDMQIRTGGSPAKDSVKYDGVPAQGLVPRISVGGSPTVPTDIESHLQDLWASVFVSFTDGSEDSVSPWELDSTNSLFQKEFQRTYKSQQMTEESRKYAVKELSTIIQDKTIELPLLTSTRKKHPYPLSLHTIIQRLNNMFYSSKSSFLNDLGHLTKLLKHERTHGEKVLLDSSIQRVVDANKAIRKKLDPLGEERAGKKKKSKSGKKASTGAVPPHQAAAAAPQIRFTSSGGGGGAAALPPHLQKQAPAAKPAAAAATTPKLVIKSSQPVKPIKKEKKKKDKSSSKKKKSKDKTPSSKKKKSKDKDKSSSKKKKSSTKKDKSPSKKKKKKDEKSTKKKEKSSTKKDKKSKSKSKSKDKIKKEPTSAKITLKMGAPKPDPFEFNPDSLPGHDQKTATKLTFRQSAPPPHLAAAASQKGGTTSTNRLRSLAPTPVRLPHSQGPPKVQKIDQYYNAPESASPCLQSYNSFLEMVNTPKRVIPPRLREQHHPRKMKIEQLARKTHEPKRVTDTISSFIGQNQANGLQSPVPDIPAIHQKLKTHALKPLGFRVSDSSKMHARTSPAQSVAGVAQGSQIRFKTQFKWNKKPKKESNPADAFMEQSALDSVGGDTFDLLKDSQSHHGAIEKAWQSWQQKWNQNPPPTTATKDEESSPSSTPSTEGGQLSVHIPVQHNMSIVDITLGGFTDTTNDSLHQQEAQWKRAGYSLQKAHLNGSPGVVGIAYRKGSLPSSENVPFDLCTYNLFLESDVDCRVPLEVAVEILPSRKRILESIPLKLEEAAAQCKSQTSMFYTANIEKTKQFLLEYDFLSNFSWDPSGFFYCIERAVSTREDADAMEIDTFASEDSPLMDTSSEGDENSMEDSESTALSLPSHHEKRRMVQVVGLEGMQFRIGNSVIG